MKYRIMQETPTGGFLYRIEYKKYRLFGFWHILDYATNLEEAKRMIYLTEIPVFEFDTKISNIVELLKEEKNEI